MLAIFRSILCILFIPASVLTTSSAFAGGITLNGTRVIYYVGQKQVSLNVRNTDEKASFMVQSWVELDDGNKTQDFIATPPLYVSGPGNENTLRLMYMGTAPKKDQESLYYFNVKAIPSLEKQKLNQNNKLMLAAVSRVKLFLRPQGLQPSPENAPAALSFHRNGSQMRIDNPTPYYITLVRMEVSGKKLPDIMVGPKDSLSLPLAGVTGSLVAYRTINDYGATTPEIKKEIK